MKSRTLSRRDLITTGGVTLGGLALGRVARSATPPVSTVAIARCRSYSQDHIDQTLQTMFDQIGGSDRW